MAPPARDSGSPPEAVAGRSGVAARSPAVATRGGGGGKRVSSSNVLSAYVLHRYDWSETSVILDLLTREQGRLAVVTKGAKRPYSQLRAVLLPFQRLSVSVGKPPKSAPAGSATSD